MQMDLCSKWDSSFGPMTISQEAMDFRMMRRERQKIVLVRCSGCVRTWYVKVLANSSAGVVGVATGLPAVEAKCLQACQDRQTIIFE